MDRDERQQESVVSLDRDTQINVVLNSADEHDTIDLGRLLHTFKEKRRVYGWVVLLFVAAGVCAALLYYQFTAKPLTVSSVVTLDYLVPNPLLDPEKNPKYDPSKMVISEIPPLVQVFDLTAPDGTELDLNQLMSSHVLSNALSGLSLSQPVTLSNLQANLRIDKLLTENSRRQQEVAARMLQDKNSDAYSQVQGIQLTYENQFVVSLTNGFGDVDSNVRYYLTDSELRMVLDRILDAYNNYMVSAYADMKLPDDELSILDVQALDVLESLDLMRAATDELYAYCDAKPDNIKAYRSWRTGRSLNDLMENLKLARSISVDYLYADAYAKDLTRDRDAMIASYEYQLRNAHTELDTVNETIAGNQALLDTYKNDDILVTTQDGEAASSAKSSTNYYNTLFTQQAQNYAAVAGLETRITNLQDKISHLNNSTEHPDVSLVNDELADAVEVCRTAYSQILEQLEEIMASTFYTTYAGHTEAQGEAVSFIVGAWKKVLLGAVAGAAVACVLWFLSALSLEFQPRKRKEPEEKEATEQ